MKFSASFALIITLMLAAVSAEAEPPAAEEVWIGLAFSGGGHRASAFSYGLLRRLEGERLADGTPLTNRVRFVAGVSGGSVTATAFTLRGMRGMRHFRDEWLLTDVEARMTADLGARDILRGVDGRATLGQLLEDNLFHGATFADLAHRQPMLRVVASDTAAAAPFVFDEITFGALCSDLSAIRLSDAVTASAAVPVVFSAVPVARHAGCVWQEPVAYAVARADEDAHPAVRLLARTVASYANANEVRSVLLLDGSMAETFGTSGFIAARAEGHLAPMTTAEALRTRRVLFLAVNASHENWWLIDRLVPAGRVLGMSFYGLAQRLREAGGGELDALLSQRAITATTTGSFDTLHATLAEWRRQIIEWRCGLNLETLDSLYPDRPEKWDCGELIVVVGEVGLRQLPEPTRNTMNSIPTRLSLPAASIDIAIDAGATALERAPAWATFLQYLQ